MTKRSIFITGGAGFIGSNSARFYMECGWHVTVFDNLSRKGCQSNMEWLKTYGNFEFIKGDIRDRKALDSALKARCYDFILHLAAQVAVTTSVKNPLEDFEINALGTFNLLESVRANCPDTFVLFASTNKVYGDLETLHVSDTGLSYALTDFPHGIPETLALDFHSPYGCSKGAADQYIIDYARIYGLRTVSFRQSCIYGYRQFGQEDQGWVAWFTIASLFEKPITFYGNGKQVRDILFVEDLIDAYNLAFANQNRVVGKSYNIGGGPRNVLSLLQLMDRLKKSLDKDIPYNIAQIRAGDQKVFVCDIRRAANDFGWKPKSSVDQGLEKLFQWVLAHESIFENIISIPASQ